MATLNFNGYEEPTIKRTVADSVAMELDVTFSFRHLGGVAKPEVKMGGPDNILEVHEFLVNLAGSNNGQNFLRTDISVQTTPEFKKEDMDKYRAPIEDAINKVLTRYSVKELKQRNIIANLQHEIARASNDALARAEGKEPSKPDAGVPYHPEWDSQTGPILKVYFTTFAFQ
jgi:flagellar basal body-associated protein FliL